MTDSKMRMTQKPELVSKTFPLRTIAVIKVLASIF